MWIHFFFFISFCFEFLLCEWQFCKISCLYKRKVQFGGRRWGLVSILLIEYIVCFFCFFCFFCWYSAPIPSKINKGCEKNPGPLKAYQYKPSIVNYVQKKEKKKVNEDDMVRKMDKPNKLILKEKEKVICNSNFFISYFLTTG